jgi:Bacterial capsule synthesis protein PGA_cap
VSDDKRIRVLVGGEVFNALPDPSAAFRHLTPLLCAGDIVFADLEGVYADEPDPAPSRRAYHVAATAAGLGLRDAPLHVVTLANNHILDGGYAGLDETFRLLEKQEIAVTGAGPSLDAALRPAVVERRGIRVAFLGFCSVFPYGYEARVERPGLAPLRVHTLYGSNDAAGWDPGSEPLISTVPHQPDVDAYGAAIANARAQADVVVVACHWGHSPDVRALTTAPTRTHSRVWRDVPQDYELTLARAAVDFGADVVACCHQQSLRAIEIYRGKPIFYGLGILVNHFHRVGERGGLLDLLSAERESSTESYPYFPFRPESRMTGVVVLDIGPDGSIEPGFVPAVVLPDGSTEPLYAGDPRAQEICAYLEARTADADQETRLALGTSGEWAYITIAAP